MFDGAPGHVGAAGPGLTAEWPSDSIPVTQGLQLGLQFIPELERPPTIRRAHTIGAPSILVNKNSFVQFQEFRTRGRRFKSSLPTNLFRVQPGYMGYRMDRSHR
jgi:hypothetical protein